MTQTRATLCAAFPCIEFLVTKITQKSQTSSSRPILIFPVKQEPDNAPHHNGSCDVTDASSRTPNTACEVLHTLSLVQCVKHLGGQQPQPQGCKFLQCFKSKGCVCSVCSNITQKFNYLYILSKTREHLTQQLLHIS